MEEHRPDASVDVTDHRDTDRLVEELNALPPFPSGGFSCRTGPAYYQLEFLYAGLDRWTVQLETGGCGRVQVAGEQKAIARSFGSPVISDVQRLVAKLSS